jgi:molecular chaperone IbpA
MAYIPMPQGGNKKYPDYDWQHKKPGLAPSNPVTINSLFPQFERWAIGFDPLFETLKTISSDSKMSSYPPYNIFKSKDNYILEIAVAGFSKEDIKISVKELTLTVEGSALPSVDNYVHKGIASRDFKQDFALAEYVVVDSAEMKDGMLRIVLSQELPEEKKPKVIEIN